MKTIQMLIVSCVFSFTLKAQVSFNLSSTNVVGNDPNSVAVADVNGDGKVDLICANYYGNSLSVLTNNGNGGFVLSGTYPVGSLPDYVIAADVNGDGKVDLICANSGGNTLSVLTNNGSGGFVLASLPVVGISPYSVVAADVNGDGKVDLISANWGSSGQGNTLTILTNNGTGGFVLASSPVVGKGPLGVAAADVNGDGKMDLISANGTDNTVTVLTNNGSGGFVLSGTYPVGGQSFVVVAADVNGDGNVDLITANWGGGAGNTLTILTNNGSGGFGSNATLTVGSGSIWVAAADVNRDGNVDLIAANYNDKTISVLTNNGSGGFVLATNLSLVNKPNSVTAADVNGDGKVDLIVPIYGNNILDVFTNATPFPIQVQGCDPAPSGLASWWPGEGNANDIVSGNNGKLMNGTGFTNGEVGMAFNLNGVYNYVLVNPASANLDVGKGVGFTIECWIKPTTVTKQQLIAEYERALGTSSSSDIGIDFVIQNTSYLDATLLETNELVGHEISTPPNSLVAGAWQHIALTYDKASGHAALYINGTAVTQKNLGSFTPQTSFTNLLFGARTTFGSASHPVGTFSGGMDEISIYNRALSSNEIAAIYNAGSAGKCPPGGVQGCDPAPSGLASWWPGEGNANDIVSGNNGKLLNGTGFTNGEVGMAFLFSTTNSGVKVPASPTLDVGLGSGLTVEGWINPNNLAIRGYIAEWNDGNTNQGQEPFGVQLTILGPSEQGLGSGNLFSDVHDAGGSPHWMAAPGGTITANKFQHVALTYNKGTGVATLYCNGAVVAQQTLGSFTPLTSYDFYMGRRPPGPESVGSFPGSIDELSVYNRALSATEIQAIYNAGSAGKCPPAPVIPPPIATGTAIVINGFVIGVSITGGGYGYTNTPQVQFIGGGGSGAQAVAVVSNGVVTAIQMLDAGFGYTNAPQVVIDPPFIPNPVLGIAPMSFLSFSNLTLGGTYQLQQAVQWYWTNWPVNFTASNTLYMQLVAGAVGSANYRLALNPVPTQAFATPQVVDGFVVAATVTSGGSGYVTSPAVTIVGRSIIGAGAYSSISGGVVTGITITNAGFGYTNTPTVQIAPPPAAAVYPTVLSVMRVDSSNLAPYDNYQIQFKPDIAAQWMNLNGGLFSPTAGTNSQFIFVTNGVGYFRLQYVP